MFSTLAMLMILLSPWTLVAQDGPIVALVGATVHTVSGDDIGNGTVLVQDGRIIAVGAGIETPDGAEVVDLSGKHLYPGFVLSASALGLTEIGAVRATNDLGEIGDNNADVRAEVAFNADSLLLPETMAGGVLTAHVSMNGGTITGTTAVMRLHGWNWQDMTISTPAGMRLDFPSVSTAGDDEEDAESSSEAIEQLDELIENAEHYAKAKAAGTVDHDPKMEGLLPLLEGEVPLYLFAYNKAQIEKALDWTAEKGLDNLVLFTGQDARYVAERLATENIPVVLTGILSLPWRAWEGYDTPFTTPSVLHEAGVRFAISDSASSFGAMNSRNLPFHAAQAAAFGLPKEIALRSVTLSPAEILGVADHIGSIDVGKEATFFVSNGDPLEIRTSIERVWVQGQEVDLKNRHQYRLYDKYNNRPRPAATSE
ncbi:MAG: amidohydrolase family protein [Thermoanaerobaculia bacterium]|nr:amidohydrolase family protein [Thermoanaerobaculia bacterium]